MTEFDPPAPPPRTHPEARSDPPGAPPRTHPGAARPNCALFYSSDGYRVDREAVKGRQAAGAGFLKGFIEHGGTDRLVALTPSRRHFEDFRALADAFDRAGRELVWARPLDRQVLRSVGTVFLPGPSLETEAWHRRFGNERDYSLCGVTHTVASDRVVQALGTCLTAPTQPWDAVICTSTAVRDAVRRMIEQHADYLARRGGGRIRNPVRLPVIPLGVDCDFYAPDEASDKAPDKAPDKASDESPDEAPDKAPDGSRASTPDGGETRRGIRARLGIADDDVAVLFVGRLSFHAKAHPTPMYMAAARAAQRTKGRTIHLLLAGQFPNSGIERQFREAAARFCGGARAHFLDGSDGPYGPATRSAWRAADVFVSLSDNIQETFGLTPVEAMAAGLPCVVSDWNGYRDTVVHGETGFRIPTTAPGPGTGVDVADRYAAGVDTYDRFIGIASLATAVDVDACADAIATLANDRELRARQGEAGMKRARRVYDWKVVVAAYQDLWTELAEIRAGGHVGVGLRDATAESARVDFPDPFSIYRGYPTRTVGPRTVVTVRSDDPAGELARLREGMLHVFADYAFLPDAEVDALIARLTSGPARVAELVADHRALDRRKLLRTLLWLKKFDVVELRPPGE